MKNLQKGLLKERLRDGARLALARQGYSHIRVDEAPRVVHGARLQVTKGKKSLLVAVRTSSDRKVRLLQTPKGGWRTIPAVDLVVVSASAEDGLAFDVYAFEPSVFLQMFKAKVRDRQRKGGLEQFLLPVTVALDGVGEKKPGKGKAIVGLASLAMWRVQVPVSEVPLLQPRVGTVDAGGARRQTSTSVKKGMDWAEFLHGIKKQIADYVGVDTSAINIEVSIKQ